nr:immunoglobulin heavy chain junction region [Macaca mulatta]MPN83852.1 immunoglobulin heavy chain junction region [Macaca mulatta]MPN83861.1 immunoglobulin heavy chain junction region [Macaca mulatta]MPN83905.1 immunoglobulin heavy chain junction region [Macaca mulatta]MPN83979.1 immunoglobulin heavy chain junction region [Macaca mulatta]
CTRDNRPLGLDSW